MDRKLVLFIVLFIALVGLAGWGSLASAQGPTPTGGTPPATGPATAPATAPATTAATAPATAPATAAATAAAASVLSATITSPTTGSTVTGTVTISGTATGPNFSYYLVQFKLGDQWTLVDDTIHKTPVTTTAALATWNSTRYGDGAYDLRVLAADTSGQFVTTTVSIKVDNSKTVVTEAPPNRGCTACHVQIAPDGRFTLGWEAMNADPKHPQLPNGFKSTFQDCMLCHASKGTTGIAGVVAPLSLRAIVHPAHLNSEVFESEFRGNCFTCHEVDNGGKFMVLPEKVNVNPKGVQTAPK